MILSLQCHIVIIFNDLTSYLVWDKRFLLYLLDCRREMCCYRVAQERGMSYADGRFEKDR